VLTAKGDLLSRSSSEIDRVAVGGDGTILSAASSESAGLIWREQSDTGRNAIINGSFDAWQRGVVFYAPASGSYTADRWAVGWDSEDSVRTVSREAFTAGNAPVAGYEGKYFLRYESSVAGASATFNNVYQPIEDVRSFAGQSVTVSCWAKSDDNVDFSFVLGQNFGDGGSDSVNTFSGTFTTSGSWQRFSAQIDVPSILGKTVGSNSSLIFFIDLPFDSLFSLDFWGVQVEIGDVASRFVEQPYYETLRHCQRYYYRFSVDEIGDHFGSGFNKSTNIAACYTPFPVTMRSAPTALIQSDNAADYSVSQLTSNIVCTSVPTFESASPNGATTNFIATTLLTAGNGSMGRASEVQAFLAWSAEL
jgi:hypothetical protein